MLIKIIISWFVLMGIGTNCILAQVEVIGDQNFSIIQNGYEINLPYFSNQDLFDSNININRAVIVIHGMNRNADDYYSSIFNNATDLDILSETIIIAPQFLVTTDLDHWQPNTAFAFWSGTTQWSSGGQSNSTNEHPRNYEISSFTIMDSLMFHILFTFPNLQDIVLVGNSAGGQFVNRYAAGTDQNLEGKLRYIIAAPSSYVYFDEYRYDDFQFPLEWRIPDDCSNYNDYKYGLDDLNHYMSMSGVDSIRERYSRRKIQYLIGASDTGGTQDCESMAQGGNRLERSIIYFNYLQYFYGSQILDNQEIALIPGVSHDYNGIFSSICGKNAIFLIGDCEQFNNFTGPIANFSSNNNTGQYPHTVNLINESVAGTHSIQQLVWNIDNEVIYSNGSVNYNFLYPGLFDVGLIAIDEIGVSDTMIIQSLVQIDTLYGDIDWDSEISESDVSLILEHVTGSSLLNPLQQATGDVNNNQAISSFDASVILQYLIGGIDSIPMNDMNSYNASGILDAPQIFGEEGEIITVPINIIEADNIYSFSISLEYDNLYLESGSVYSDAISEYGFMIESVVTDSGSIKVAGASSVPFEGETLLFNLYFIPTNFQGGNTIIECDEFIVNDTLSLQNFQIVVDQQLNTKNNIIPNDIALHYNFPNPFNNNTVIRYHHDGNNNINLYITDIKGSLIKSLHEGIKTRGMKNVYWDGTNNFGFHVRSGIYFYTLKTEKIKKTKKMLLLK